MGPWAGGQLRVLFPCPSRIALQRINSWTWALPPTTRANVNVSELLSCCGCGPPDGDGEPPALGPSLPSALQHTPSIRVAMCCCCWCMPNCPKSCRLKRRCECLLTAAVWHGRPMTTCGCALRRPTACWALPDAFIAPRTIYRVRMVMRNRRLQKPLVDVVNQ